MTTEKKLNRLKWVYQQLSRIKIPFNVEYELDPFVVYEIDGNWSVKVFYDVGEFDHIDSFIEKEAAWHDGPVDFEYDVFEENSDHGFNIFQNWTPKE